MKTITKISLFLLLSLSIISCEISGISGDGNIKTETRKANGKFNKIKASSGLAIYLTQGDRARIEVKADANLQDLIKTTVSDGVLKIYTTENIRKAASKKVYVTVPELEAITVTSGANFVSENQLTAADITISISSGASASIAIIAQNIDTSVSSGASLSLKGSTNKLEASASSGANIDAYALKTVNADLSASSGASVDATAIDTIEASASSGGSIDYKGNPKHKTIHKSSGGSVSKK